MIPGDEILFECTESELLWMARVQGYPVLKRGLPREELVAIVAGDMKPQEHHLAGTNYTRGRLEHWLQSNIEVVRTQLPGCNGMCRSWMCTEGKHLACFTKTETLLL